MMTPEQMHQVTLFATALAKMQAAVTQHRPCELTIDECKAMVATVQTLTRKPEAPRT